MELIRSVKKVEKPVLSRCLNVRTLSAAMMDLGIEFQMTGPATKKCSVTELGSWYSVVAAAGRT